MRARLMTLATAAMVPGFIILGMTEFEIAQSRKEEVRDLALRNASQAASEMERIIAGVDAMINAVSKAPAVKYFREPECSSYLRDLQQSLPQITGIVIVDTDGQLRCGSVVPPPTANLADRDYVKHALASSSLVVGTYIVGRASHKQVLPVALSIRNQEGMAYAVAIAGIDLAWLGQQLHDRVLPQDGSLMVADRDGIILARSPSPEKYVGTQVPDSFMSRITSAAPGVQDVVGLDGTARVLAYIPPAIERYGLYVSAGLSVEESYKAVQRAITRGIYLAAVLAVATLGATWFVGSRFFVRPINKLLSVINKWRDGKQDARTGLMADAGELNKLGAELDRMIEQIIRDQDDKQLLADELMHRIKNTITMVYALAYSTMNRPQPANEILPHFLKRLQALSETNDLLYTKQWRGADLGRLIKAVITPLLTEPDSQVEITGPQVQLSPREAFRLTMIFHELCTNAIKHGALREPEGNIKIVWQVTGNRLDIRWMEEAPSEIPQPSSHGLGTKLIYRALGAAGNVNAQFLPTGLRCGIGLELGQL